MALELAESRVSCFLAASSSPPNLEIVESRYALRFAQTHEDVIAAQRLRYEVFNLELQEGLTASHAIGLDRDQFDSRCFHLVVEDVRCGGIVGTYRVLPFEHAGSVAGYYSNQEFILDRWPSEILENAVEVGRACIAREHRNSRVLFLLWKGIARFLTETATRYAFGCCSMPGTDANLGWRAYEQFQRMGYVESSLVLDVRSDASFSRSAVSPEPVVFPPLLNLYLNLGARVCSAPAFDHAFGTTDFLILLDTASIPLDQKRKYFPR